MTEPFLEFTWAHTNAAALLYCLLLLVLLRVAVWSRPPLARSLTSHFCLPAVGCLGILRQLRLQVMFRNLLWWLLETATKMWCRGLRLRPLLYLVVLPATDPFRGAAEI